MKLIFGLSLCPWLCQACCCIWYGKIPAVSSFGEAATRLKGTYLRAREIRWANSFSQAYILITWMPTIISFINLTRSSVLLAVRRRYVDSIFPKYADKDNKTWLRTKCKYHQYQLRLHSTSAWILLPGLKAVFMLQEPVFQPCTFASFSFWLLCKIMVSLYNMHITKTEVHKTASLSSCSNLLLNSAQTCQMFSVTHVTQRNNKDCYLN